MRSNTTNSNHTPTNAGHTPSSINYTSVPTETLDLLIRSQTQRNENTSPSIENLSFSSMTVISMIGIIIGAVVAVLGVYYNFKSDLTALSVRIDALDKDLQSANAENLKKDILDTRSEIKNIQQSISNYDFKSINENIIKININIDNMKSEINKINDKQLSKIK